MKGVNKVNREKKKSKKPMKLRQIKISRENASEENMNGVFSRIYILRKLDF